MGLLAPASLGKTGAKKEPLFRGATSIAQEVLLCQGFFLGGGAVLPANSRSRLVGAASPEKVPTDSPIRVPPPSLIPKGGTRLGRGDRRAWRKPPWHRRCHQGSRLPPRSALNGAHWAPAPPKGGGETWLSLWGRYVPVGRCPAARVPCEKPSAGSLFYLPALANAIRPWGRCPFSAAASGAVCQWQTSSTDRRGSGDQALDGAHRAPAPPATFEKVDETFTRLRRARELAS